MLIFAPKMRFSRLQCHQGTALMAQHILLNNYKEMEFELIAKTFMGLEPILAQELTELGANDIQIGRRMVSFKGDKELMYRANFQLRTAIRILKPIIHFKARSADDVYNEVLKVDWTKYLDNNKTFAVDSVVFSEEFRHSNFVAYKVKDAIVDQFRESTGTRPNISVTNPDLRLHIHIADEDGTLSLDSSGESLHRRGYRQESVEAPLNEVLAAGMILMTGWKGETGHTYTLQVTLDGHHYEAVSTMPPAAPIVSTQFVWQPVLKNHLLTFTMWATDPEPDVRNFYWYRMERHSVNADARRKQGNGRTHLPRHTLHDGCL